MKILLTIVLHFQIYLVEILRSIIAFAGGKKFASVPFYAVFLEHMIINSQHNTDNDIS